MKYEMKKYEDGIDNPLGLPITNCGFANHRFVKIAVVRKKSQYFEIYQCKKCGMFKYFGIRKLKEASK